MDGWRQRFYNAEGYADPTAYNAIYKSNGKVVKVNIWKDGDVVKNTGYGGDERYSVILKMHRTYATTIPLFDREVGEHRYEIRCIGPMWIEPGKIAYMNQNKLRTAEFVRVLSADEYSELCRKVGEATGIGFKQNDSITTPLQHDQDTLFQSVLEDPAIQTDIKSILDLQKELGIVKAERDVYKELCLRYIDRDAKPIHAGMERYDESKNQGGCEESAGTVTADNNSEFFWDTETK